MTMTEEDALRVLRSMVDEQTGAPLGLPAAERLLFSQRMAIREAILVLKVQPKLHQEYERLSNDYDAASWHLGAVEKALRACLAALDRVEPQVKGVIPVQDVHFAQEQARAALEGKSEGKSEEQHA